MIGYFPTPFDNETLYSLVARYHKEMKNTNTKDTYLELFGHKEITFRKDMFNHAKNMEENLKHFKFFTATEIINKLTHVNYYRIFLPKYYFNDYIDWMINNYKHETFEYIKLIVGRRDKLGGLYYRYCKNCVDEKQLYWKLNHNLPGGFYCLKHNKLLTNSVVDVNTRKLKCLSEIEHRSSNISVSRKEQILLKKMHILTEELFLNVDYPLESINSYYHIFLHKKGYYNRRTGLYSHTKLQKDFQNVFTENICDLLNVDIKRFKLTALAMFFSKHNYEKYQPIYHVMIMAFLGITLEDLENRGIITHLGEIKCENSSCKNYLKNNIKFNFVNRNFGEFTCNVCESNYYIRIES